MKSIANICYCEEQTMLLLSTLKHFGHTENVKLKVMHGRHCAYVRETDENGDSIFGKLVLELIRNLRKRAPQLLTST